MRRRHPTFPKQSSVSSPPGPARWPGRSLSRSPRLSVILIASLPGGRDEHKERDLRVGHFETLLYEEQDGVAIVTLNRPEVLNAFNRQMQRELRELWRSLCTNDDVRAIVLTGAGDKAFCSGIDRKESIEEGYLRRDPSDTRRVSTTAYTAVDPGLDLNPKANNLWKPVVAAVNGMACGGALYLLGEADIIIAAEHATFFDPHVSYGMVAGFEPTHLLQKLPFGETLRVALLGVHERMSAARAYELGLVSEVTSADQLMERAMWIGSANRICSGPGRARHRPGHLGSQRALAQCRLGPGFGPGETRDRVRESRSGSRSVQSRAPRVEVALATGSVTVHFRPAGTPGRPDAGLVLMAALGLGEVARHRALADQCHRPVRGRTDHGNGSRAQASRPCP